MSTPTADAVTEVTITVSTADGDHQLCATLNSTPTARALLDRLPLRLHFRDVNEVEKSARLPEPLTMRGMPVGDDPEPGDVGFYAPTGALVLYYRDVGFWPGIARIGRLTERSVRVLAEQHEDFTAVVAASGSRGHDTNPAA